MSKHLYIQTLNIDTEYSADWFFPRQKKKRRRCREPLAGVSQHLLLCAICHVCDKEDDCRHITSFCVPKKTAVQRNQTYM